MTTTESKALVAENGQTVVDKPKLYVDINPNATAEELLVGALALLAIGSENLSDSNAMKDIFVRKSSLIVWLVEANRIKPTLYSARMRFNESLALMRLSSLDIVLVDRFPNRNPLHPSEQLMWLVAA